MDKSNKKIKVCFVSPFAYGVFYPESKLKFGGSEVQMSILSKELSLDLNYNTSLLVLDDGQNWEEKREGDIRLIKAYKRGRGLNIFKAPIILLLKLIEESPDVVVCRANGVEVGIARFYAKLFKKKFIYSIACDDDILGRFFKGLRGRIFKWGFETADYLIAQSFWQREELIKKYSDKKDRVEVIRNGFEMSNMESSDRKTILWVGSSASVKQPDIFMDMVKEFPEEKFVMIMTKSKAGIGKWKDINDLAKNLSNLELIDFVPFNQVGDYFKKAKVFVNTSSYEGFPNTFIQAGIASTPILSFKVDPDNFIKDNNCGIVCNGDKSKLIQSLRSILKDKEEAKKMSKNIFNYISEKHNIVSNIKDWKRIFNRLVN